MGIGKVQMDIYGNLHHKKRFGSLLSRFFFVVLKGSDYIGWKDSK